MNIKLMSFSSAAIAWLLAVILVWQLLSGNFETRTCQTGCVQSIYWVSFGLVVLGLVVTAFNYQQVLRSKSGIATTIALFLLLFIYLITMGVGTFG